MSPKNLYDRAPKKMFFFIKKINSRTKKSSIVLINN